MTNQQPSHTGAEMSNATFVIRKEVRDGITTLKLVTEYDRYYRLIRKISKWDSHSDEAMTLTAVSGGGAQVSLVWMVRARPALYLREASVNGSMVPQYLLALPYDSVRGMQLDIVDQRIYSQDRSGFLAKARAQAQEAVCQLGVSGMWRGVSVWQYLEGKLGGMKHARSEQWHPQCVIRQEYTDRMHPVYRLTYLSETFKRCLLQLTKTHPRGKGVSIPLTDKVHVCVTEHDEGRMWKYGVDTDTVILVLSMQHLTGEIRPPTDQCRVFTYATPPVTVNVEEAAQAAMIRTADALRHYCHDPARTQQLIDQQEEKRARAHLEKALARNERKLLMPEQTNFDPIRAEGNGTMVYRVSSDTSGATGIRIIALYERYHDLIEQLASYEGDDDHGPIEIRVRDEAGARMRVLWIRCSAPVLYIEDTHSTGIPIPEYTLVLPLLDIAGKDLAIVHVTKQLTQRRAALSNHILMLLNGLAIHGLWGDVDAWEHLEGRVAAVERARVARAESQCLIHKEYIMDMIPTYRFKKMSQQFKGFLKAVSESVHGIDRPIMIAPGVCISLAPRFEVRQMFSYNVRTRLITVTFPVGWAGDTVPCEQPGTDILTYGDDGIMANVAGTAEDAMDYAIAILKNYVYSKEEKIESMAVPTPLGWQLERRPKPPAIFKIKLTYTTEPVEFNDKVSTNHVLRMEILEQSEALRKKAAGVPLEFVASNGFKIISDQRLASRTYIPEIGSMCLHIRGEDRSGDHVALVVAYPDEERFKHYYSSLLRALDEWKACGYRYVTAVPPSKDYTPLPEFTWGD